MKKINIVLGTYGYRKNDTSPVELINSENGPIEVSDEEASRLIKLGIAEEYKEPAVVEETTTGNLDAESLEEYTVAELKALAVDLGLEFKSRATKDELIKLITAVEVEYATADDTEAEEADTEEPPVLNAVDPE